MGSRRIFQNIPKPNPELEAALAKVRQEPTGTTTQQECGNAAAPLPVAGPDREVWVRNQVMTAMRMALALRAERHVGADEDAYNGGMWGVAEGAAVEILRTLGFDTQNLVNLRK